MFGAGFRGAGSPQTLVRGWTMVASYLGLLVTVFSWALSHPLGRLIVQQVHPLQLAALNLSVGFFCLGVVLAATRRLGGVLRMSFKDILGSLSLGAFGFFFYQFCAFVALAHIPASMNAVLISSNVIIIVFLSAIFLKERIRPLVILGVFLSLAGVVIVTFNRGFRLTERWDLTGCALSLAAAAAFAFYTVAGKKILSRNDPLLVATLALFSGAAMLWLLCRTTIGLQQLRSITGQTWGLVLLLGVTSIGLAYPFYFSSLKKLPASTVSVFLNLIPAIAVLLSLLLLRERFAWPFWLGCALVLGGVAASNLAGRPARKLSR